MYKMLIVASLLSPVEYRTVDYPFVQYETMGLPKGYVSYADGQAKAKATGKPLVVFVGVSPREIEGVVTCWTDTLKGVDDGSIVVAVPNPSIGLEWKSTLPKRAGNVEIRRAAGLGVSRSVFPFFRKIADDSPNARQLPTWFPRDAVRYHHAENTQAIYVLNDQQTIEPIDRRRLERKWQFPGGLDEVGGWASDLYRSVPDEPRQMQRPIPVLNSLGYIQHETGWHRTYPDGSWFADVLSTEGNVFEVRVREKKDGVWDSYVAYRNSRYYPVGYVPVKSSECAGCHNQAGTGEYGVGLVPGSDTVISDPFDSLR